MKKILIVVGHTGAGKSTICQNISKLYNIPLISFASVGKTFSNDLGYKRIRECYQNIGARKFKEMLSEYFYKQILAYLDKCDHLIIEGLYFDDIAQRLKCLYETLCVYIKVSEQICIKRVAERMGISYEKAVNEYKLKEDLKCNLGFTSITNYVDVIIDGTKDKTSVYREIVEFNFFN